ncbi:MAG TPA: VWA domain-containing protein, partial [Bryobacteraceae bacterium]|nr:VWA domain-containing protein [Bryobacteraceae bacterium]
GQPQAISAVRASATRILALGESEAQQTFSVLRDVVARMSTAPGERAMVLISTGIYLTEIYRSYESELLDRALRAKVTISTLNMHGSFVASQTDIDRGSTAKSATARLGYTQQEAQAGDDILTELAEGTGGTYFHNSNDAAEGLRVTAATPEYIYLLGFAPQNLKYDGKFHSVKVALKAANYTLEARRGYYAPRQAPNEQLQAQEELKEWMYSREDSQEFPIALETQFFKPTSESGRITALGKVDLHGVRFVKAEGRNRDTIYIVVGIFDRNGNILKAGGRVVDLKFKDETMAAHIEQGLALKLSFDVAPGKYLVRLVVRSSEGEMMAARNGVVEIP